MDEVSVLNDKISKISEPEILEGYKLIVELAQDAIFVKDLESRYILANQRTLEVFNLHREKAIGKNDYDLFPPKQAKVNIEDDQRVFRTGQPVEISKKMTAAGKKRYFQAIKTPLKDDEGKVIGLIGIARDITAQKKTEEEQKDSERRFKEITENINDVIFELSPTGYIRYVSPTIKKYGYTPDELVGKHLKKITPLKEVPRALRALKKIVQGKPVKKLEIGQMAKNKKIVYMKVKAVPIIRNGKMTGILGIMRPAARHTKVEEKIKQEKKKTEDLLTKLNTSYKKLKETQNELIRRERMATAGSFAAGIAHEVRNPLANVVMSIQQIKKAVKSDDPAAKHVNIIERNAQRINYLITELLNSARPPKLKIRSYDINKVIRDVLNSVRTKVKLNKIKVIRKLMSKKSSVLEIDRELMSRVFTNLINNAIETMPNGGKLTIVTGPNEDFFIVKIQDTGRGIPEKDIMRIFDPFFSSKPEGVGLGLTICYGIIVSHGGTIEVESKHRKGTIFTVSLPVEQTLREICERE